MVEIKVSAPNVVVESYNIPTSVKVNEYTSISITGHVTGAGDNCGVAFAYIDGPAPSVVVNYEGVDYTIEKGKAFVLYRPGASGVCTRITMNARVKYPVEGSYQVAALAGYADLEKNIFYYTDRKDVYVNASGAPPPAKYAIVSGTVTQVALFGLIARPHVGVEVTLDDKSTITDSTGYYEFRDVEVRTTPYILSVKPTTFFTGASRRIYVTEAKNYVEDFTVGVRPEVIAIGIGGAAAAGITVAVVRKK